MYEYELEFEAHNDYLNENAIPKLNAKIDLVDRFNVLLDNLEVQQEHCKTIDAELFKDLIADINEAWGLHWTAKDNWIDEHTFIEDCGVSKNSFRVMKSKGTIPVQWFIDYVKRVIIEQSIGGMKDFSFILVPNLTQKIEEHEERIKALERTVAEQAETIRILQQKTIGMN